MRDGRPTEAWHGWIGPSGTRHVDACWEAASEPTGYADWTDPDDRFWLAVVILVATADRVPDRSTVEAFASEVLTQLPAGVPRQGTVWTLTREQVAEWLAQRDEAAADAPKLTGDPTHQHASVPPGTGNAGRQDGSVGLQALAWLAIAGVAWIWVASTVGTAQAGTIALMIVGAAVTMWDPGSGDRPDDQADWPLCGNCGYRHEVHDWCWGSPE